jgi:hypothetical protein
MMVVLSIIVAANVSFGQESASAEVKSPVGKLLASSKSINFGEVHAISTGSFTLRNAGSAAVTGSVGVAAPPFSRSSGSGAFSLKPGAHSR